MRTKAKKLSSPMPKPTFSPNEEAEQQYEEELRMFNLLYPQTQQQQTQRAQKKKPMPKKPSELDFWAYERLRAARLAIAYKTGRQACRALCTAIHTSLPRELRDLVYDHLMPPGRTFYVYNGIHDKTIVPNVSFFHSRSRMPEEVRRRQDTWRYSAYTGAILGREIAERWYATGVFVLDAGDTGYLEHFLRQDVWERGIRPADVVRSLRIDLYPEYALEEEIAEGQMEWVFGWGLRPAERAISSLTRLYGLGNTRAEIVFNVTAKRYGHGGAGAMLVALRELRPIVRGLRERGFRKVVVRQSVCEDVEKDVTGYCVDEVTESV